MNRFQAQIKHSLIMQLLVILIVAVIWSIYNRPSGIAALSGGLVALLSNAYFAWRVFRRMEVRSAKQILLALYMNEMLKLLGCALMILALIHTFHLAVIPLLTGLLAAYLVVAPMAIYQQIKMVKR